MGRRFPLPSAGCCEGLIRRLLPEPCLLCGGRGGGVALCDGCRDELPRNPCCCERCALPLAQPGVCGACLRKPPAFDAALIPFLYYPPCNRAVTRLKFSGQLRWARWMGQLMADEFEGNLSAESMPDLLLPVPLHANRLRERGFNQSREIGRELSRRLSLPLRPDLLVRLIDTPPQSGLDAAERRRNLCGAFAVCGDVAGQSVAIVDDVVTTATTVELLAGLLKRAGARRVSVWAFARTP